MGLWRNLFGKKPGAGAPNGGTGEKQPPSGSSPERVDLGPLLEGLGRYEASLQVLVGNLGSGGSRAAMNLQLQRLTGLDLGCMIYEGLEFEKAYGPQIERLRVSLERIKAAAEKAGGHIEGGARPPSSLQDVLDSAMGGAGGDADLPPALRVIIPSILMITKSTLNRIAKLTPVVSLASGEAGRKPARGTPMDAEEFDRLARACYISLEEWYVRSVMTVSGGSQAEMINKLRSHIDAFASQVPQVSGEMLENIRILDERLHLGGRVIALCREASDQFVQFRKTVNGADWQQAVKKSHDAAEALDAARKKLVGSGFGGVSVTINP